MKEPQAETAKAALGGEPAKKSTKLKVREVNLRRGHAGGYIAKHRLEDADGNMHPREHEYPLTSMKDVHEHLDRHMPQEDEAKGAADKKGADTE